jgi:hypothetical protein
MEGLDSLRRIAAFCALLVGACVVGNLLLGLLAIDFKMEALQDPVLMLEVGAPGASLLYYSWVCDMLNYLLTLPIVVYVWRAAEARQRDMASLHAIGGLVYAVVGSIGAVILAVMDPELVHRYATASAAQRESIRLLFQSIHTIVVYGMWPLLETLPLTVWLVGLGRWLRPSAPAVGMATYVLAVLVLISPLSYILRIDSLRGTVAILWVFVFPFWAFALGASLWKANRR